MLDLYAVNICDGMTGSEWELLYRRISAARKLKVDRFRFDNDKKRSLLGETLIAYALQYQYGISREEISFRFNEFGKPELEGRADIFFNLSHSGDWVVCAVGDIPVGIDVEIIKAMNESVCKKVLTAKEYEFYSNIREKRDEWFYERWTLKESYVKAIGIGLSMSFDRIEFSSDGTGNIRVDCDGKRDLGYTFVSTHIGAKHMLAVCVKEEGIISKISDMNYISIAQLVSF